MARRTNPLSLAESRKQRSEIARQIEREIKAKNRARLVELRGVLRSARAERRAAIRAAREACAARRRLPTVRQLARELAEKKKAARSACDADITAARALSDRVAGARGELLAERRYQGEIRRIESANRARARAAPRARGRERRQESDGEVRANIPPELAALFDRVKRQIKGSSRESRTEAFLRYAEEHPDEQWGALEDRTDEVIRELERRQAMANPKKKKKRAKARNPSKGKKVARARKATIVAKLKHEVQHLRYRVRELGTKKKKKRKNPRRPPGVWWEHCLASVEATRYARDPAAVCGAAWWRLPLTRRQAIVRKLERGSHRDRRAAVAIAKAERRHAHRGRKKKTR